MKSLNLKNKSQYNLYYTLVVYLLFILIAFSLIKLTYSWFYEQDSTSKVIIVGNVRLDVVINDTFDEGIVAPSTIYSSMPTTIKTSANNTSGNALIRIKYTCNSTKLTVYGVDPNLWISNVEGGETYYYYKGVINNTLVTFNTGYQMARDVTNADVGFGLNFTFTIYGLQSQYKAYREEWPNAPAAWVTFANSL